MKPIKTINSNATFVAVNGFNLPATITHTDDGQKVIETAWQLDAIEREQVARNGVVFVRLVGVVPPMNVEAVSIVSIVPVEPPKNPPFNFVGEEPVERGCPFDEDIYHR